MRANTGTLSRIIVAAILAAVLVAFAAGCVTVPTGEVLPGAGTGATGFLLIAHGYGNNPSHWPARLITQIRQSDADISQWDIYAHDWEVQANKAVTAARTGYAIGREMARQLIAGGDGYQILHLIGQSMGAYLTQGFVDEYRRLHGRALIHMTFMEPFLIRGILGFGYGVRHFGRGADFAENFIVRHEPVLGSNRFLRHAHNTDISALVREDLKDDFFGPHWWVVEYYRQSVTNEWPGFDRSPISRSLAGDPGLTRRRLAAMQAAFPPGERLVLPAN
jgi:pimeloyl-ACP methyl ester carboxylesterase